VSGARTTPRLAQFIEVFNSVDPTISDRNFLVGLNGLQNRLTLRLQQFLGRMMGFSASYFQKTDSGNLNHQSEPKS